MPQKAENTFALLHIPVLIKSKKYFAIVFRFIFNLFNLTDLNLYSIYNSTALTAEA